MKTDDLITPEAVSNALQLRKYEGPTWQEHECRRAILAAEAVGGKVRLHIETVESLLVDHRRVQEELPKAHRCSA